MTIRMKTLYVEIAIIALTLLVCKFLNNQKLGRWNILVKNTRGTSLNQQTWFDFCSLTIVAFGMLFQKIALFLPWTKEARHLALVSGLGVFKVLENHAFFLHVWKDPSFKGEALINTFADMLCGVAGYEFAKYTPYIPTVFLSGALIYLIPCQS